MTNRPPSIAHSPESRQAAEQIKPNAGTMRAAVLRFIASRGTRGAIDDEVQLGLGMNPSTERPRRIELYESRLIVKTVSTRKTRTGRSAVVWVETTVASLSFPRTSYRVYPEQ